MSLESCYSSDALVRALGQHQWVALYCTDVKLDSPQVTFSSTRRLEAHFCPADKASAIVIPTWEWEWMQAVKWLMAYLVNSSQGCRSKSKLMSVQVSCQCVVGTHRNHSKMASVFCHTLLHLGEQPSLFLSDSPLTGRVCCLPSSTSSFNLPHVESLRSQKHLYITSHKKRLMLGRCSLNERIMEPPYWGHDRQPQGLSLFDWWYMLHS